MKGTIIRIEQELGYIQSTEGVTFGFDLEDISFKPRPGMSVNFEPVKVAFTREYFADEVIPERE